MINAVTHFEALVTETETVFKNSWVIPKSMMPQMIPINNECGRNIIYSRLLDECLNVDDYDIIQDSVSTLGIFKLASNMYTMSGCHHIGLKQFDNAYLLIELFNAKMLESSESEEYYEKVLEFVEKIGGDSLKLYPWQKRLIKDFLKRRTQN